MPYELLEDGVYPFEVLEKEIRKSSKGNPMAAYKLDVQGPEASKHVYDYMMESDAAWAIKKKLAFCKSCSTTASTDLIDLPGVGATGKVKITTEAAQDKGDGSGEEWPEKNKVVDYIEAPKVEDDPW